MLCCSWVTGYYGILFFKRVIVWSNFEATICANTKGECMQGQSSDVREFCLKASGMGNLTRKTWTFNAKGEECICSLTNQTYCSHQFHLFALTFDFMLKSFWIIAKGPQINPTPKLKKWALRVCIKPQTQSFRRSGITHIMLVNGQWSLKTSKFISSLGNTSCKKLCFLSAIARITSPPPHPPPYYTL